MMIKYALNLFQESTLIQTSNKAEEIDFREDLSIDILKEPLIVHGQVLKKSNHQDGQNIFTNGEIVFSEKVFCTKLSL